MVPFLKVVNDTAIAVNQGGKRKGAVCGYLETWHIDVEEFLDLRKNTGDDRRRTHDMNTANWVPDLFMERVEEDGNWTLFSPDEVPDLHDLYGAAFAERYAFYEAKAQRGEMKVTRTVRAQELWRKMLTMLFETGHPWITFKDPCNLRSPQQHAGVVHSSNLCTEITLNTNNREIAVCNLGSVNLANHVTQGRHRRGASEEDGHDRDAHARQRHRHQLLHRAGGAAIQSAPSSRGARHHGLSGCALHPAHSLLHRRSRCALPTKAWRLVSFHAISASVDLAAERGRYATFEGSLWSRGILPIDSIELLQKNRKHALQAGSLREARLGGVARAREDCRHAQLQHDGDCADGDDLQHLRRHAVDRADLSESFCEVEHVRRLHGRQRCPGARSEAARPVG